MLKRILIPTLIVLALILLGQHLYPETGGLFKRTLSNVVNPSSESQLPTESSTQPQTPIESNLPGGFLRRTTSLNAASISVEDIIDATNSARVAAGLAPFQTNKKLASSATVKTDDMIARNYFEHTAPTGEGVAELGTQAGYDYITLGENLALGNFTSAQDLVSAWMKSPGHRANILNPLYQEMGVSAKKGIYQGKLVWFAVQHFGTNREVCPSISNSTKQAIDTLKNSLAKQEKEISEIRETIDNAESIHSDEYKNALESFTAEVTDYNTKLARLKERIDRYNTQVVSFNECLSLYQKK